MALAALALAVTLPQIVSSPPALAVRGTKGEFEATESSVAVTAEGLVGDCRVFASSGFPDLDAKGCAVLSKATFRPASDAEGAPVSARLDVQVRWPGGDVVVAPGPPDVESTIASAPAGAPGLASTQLVAA